MFPDIKREEYSGSRGNGDELTLAALTYCEHCHEAIAFLKERDVSFRYFFLDALPHHQRGPVLRELKMRTGNDLIFPLLITPDRLIKGFDREQWRDALALPAG
ncbi:MAG: glutaredoxin family protein [Alkalispirochaetaceae bacterium]